MVGSEEITCVTICNDKRDLIAIGTSEGRVYYKVKEKNEWLKYDLE